nr:xanthine dehydrogenase accessory protein XdhC [Lutimaribacter sp. EGI FJ00013]
MRAAVADHGMVARVVIARVAGSSPREVGAAMLIWESGQSGTIGGGALEFQAAQAARKALRTGEGWLRRHALGPDLGQCCGGAVVVLCDLFDAARLEAFEGGQSASPEHLAGKITDGVFARASDGGTDMPLSVARVLDRARARGERPVPQLLDGWMIEPVLRPTVPVWIWGAGHVGRAIVDVLAPLPELDIVWIDTDIARFPGETSPGVEIVPVPDPALLMPHAPGNAHHLVLTYSHALDLSLCDAALRRGFASAGVIGSATKRARFRRRLGEMGHGPAQIARIACPIGDPALGKHPQAIAIGVAAGIVEQTRRHDRDRERTTG